MIKKIVISLFILTAALAAFIIYGIVEFTSTEPLQIIPLAQPTSTKDISSQAIIHIKSGDQFYERLQAALITSAPNSIIELPAGHFKLLNEISMTKSFITLRGQGKGKTILDFEGQRAGKQGVFATSDGVTIEDLSVWNSDGNGIKITGSNGVVIRRVEVKWTRGPNTNNGGYAIYPVNTQNVLIEECETMGASDSGIYVGQSKNVIVRNNLAYQNVAGIEIENTQNADVYDNIASQNTAGFLIFDLPDLNLRQGGDVRVYNNKSFNNNWPNFAPLGSIVSDVAKGVGMLILATKKVEVFNNHFYENNFANVVIANYLISGLKVKNEQEYDPTPKAIYIHNNIFDEYKKIQFNFKNEISLVTNWHFKTDTPDILYDGILDGTYNKEKFTGDNRICIINNKNSDGSPSRFGNMHLDSDRKVLIFPGGPSSTDITPHDCELPRISQAQLEPPQFSAARYPDSILTASMACEQIIDHKINFKAALTADCDNLASYNLFKNKLNPLENPMEKGFKYQLSSALFSDYALKARFIFVPDLQKIGFQPTSVFDFPVGTIITKTFWYQHQKDKSKKKIVETRLLIHRPIGWVALPYIWNENQTEATLQRGGTELDISSEWLTENTIKEKTFHYNVPNSNQCWNCHSLANKIHPIGPKAKWLNSEGTLQWHGKNQIQAMIDEKYFNESTLEKDFSKIVIAGDYNNETLPISQRARAYLDINCAHCHSPNGTGGMSGLWLEYEREESSSHLGICKSPIAAGTAAAEVKFDIVPGHPEKSLLIKRLSDLRPANKMPEVGRNLVHTKGVALVSRWIQTLDGKCE